MSKTTKALAILGVVAGLGVAALPISAMAATTGNSSTPATDTLTVQTTIEDYISIEITSGATGESHNHVLALGDDGKIVNDGEIKEGTVTVNLKTNYPKGYKLNMQASGDGALTDPSNPGNKIPGGVPAKGNSAWGFKLNSGSTVGSVSQYETYGAVPTESTMIASGTVPTTAAGLNALVTFGVTASADQAAGTYSNTVTFTASANVQ